MRIKLKENPREWQKFTAATAVLLATVATMLWKRHVISLVVLISLFIALSMTLLTCLIRPCWFRLFYRAGMTLSSAIGQAMSAVLLAVFYLCVLTPLALITRLFGRDLLKLKKTPNIFTYWQPAKPNERFDREF